MRSILRRIRDFLRDLLRAFSSGFIYARHQPSFSAAETLEDYDSYWRKRLNFDKPPLPNSYQLYRADWIAARCVPNRDIVDIGAGPGQILRRLREHGFANLTALESSPACLEMLRRDNITTIQGSIDTPEVLASLPTADVFILSELLEHLPKPEQVLQEVIGKARESVFFSFPNTGYWAERLRLLTGRFPVQWRVHPGEHLRFWTASDLEWWLDQMQLREAAEIGLYEGVPGLNKVFPKLFAKAMIARIDCTKLPGHGRPAP